MHSSLYLFYNSNIFYIYVSKYAIHVYTLQNPTEFHIIELPSAYNGKRSSLSAEGTQTSTKGFYYVDCR